MKILIIHRGFLGDTIAALPALWTIRNKYPKAYIILVSHSVSGYNTLTAKDVLNGIGVVDKIYIYRYFKKSRLWTAINIFITMIRAGFFWDIAISLHSKEVNKKEIDRHLLIFKLLQAKKMIFPRSEVKEALKNSDGSFKKIKSHAEDLLDLVKPVFGKFKIHGDLFNIDNSVEKKINNFLEDNNILNKKKIAFCISSNMQSKKWKFKKYVSIIKKIVKKYDIVPLLFGGKVDEPELIKMVKYVPESVVITDFSIREAVCLMKHCEFYLGNDTGTMHMAAAAGIACIAIFSARDIPGRWYPAGKRHIILRKAVKCEGCMEYTCNKKNRCIDQISEEEVLKAVDITIQSKQKFN